MMTSSDMNYSTQHIWHHNHIFLYTEFAFPLRQHIIYIVAQAGGDATKPAKSYLYLRVACILLCSYNLRSRKSKLLQYRSPSKREKHEYWRKRGYAVEQCCIGCLYAYRALSPKRLNKMPKQCQHNIYWINFNYLNIHLHVFADVFIFDNAIPNILIKRVFCITYESYFCTTPHSAYYVINYIYDPEVFPIYHVVYLELLTNESDQLAGSIHLFSWKTHITTWPRHYLQMNLTSSQDQSIGSHGRHTSQHGPDITYKWIWPARRINPSVLMEDTHHNMAQTLLTNESDQLAGSIHRFSWKTHITTWPRHYLQMNLTSSQDQSICSHGRHTSQHGPDITYKWIWPARRINPSVLMEDTHHNMAQTLLTNESDQLAGSIHRFSWKTHITTWPRHYLQMNLTSSQDQSICSHGRHTSQHGPDITYKWIWPARRINPSVLMEDTHHNMAQTLLTNESDQLAGSIHLFSWKTHITTWPRHYLQMNLTSSQDQSICSHGRHTSQHGPDITYKWIWPARRINPSVLMEDTHHNMAQTLLTNESDQLAGSIHRFSWKTHITTWPRHYLQMNLTSSQDQSICSHGRHTSQHGPDITYKWIWPARRINPSVLMEDTHHNMAQTLLTNESDQLAGSIHLFSWKTHITTWPRHYLQMNLTSSQDQSICSHGRHTSQHGPDITYKWIWPARRINPSVLMEDTHHNMAQTLLTNESDQLAESIHLFSWQTHLTTTWPRHYLQMNLTSSQDQSIGSHGRHTSQHGPDITYKWIWPARRINPSVLMEDTHHNMTQTLLTNESDQLAGSIHLFSWKTHITTWPRHYLQMNLTSSKDQSICSHGRHTSQHGPDITYKWIWPARRINPSVLMEDTHHNMAQTLLTNESDQLAGSIHRFSWKTHITTWPRHYLQMNLTSSQDQSICSHGRHTSQHGPDITYRWIWPARRINPSVLMEDTHHNMAQTLLTNESDQLAGSIHLFSWKTHITTWPRHYLQMNLTISQDQSICSHGRHTSQHGPDITYKWIWPARRINPSVLMEDTHHNMAQTLLTNESDQLAGSIHRFSWKTHITTWPRHYLQMNLTSSQDQSICSHGRHTSQHGPDLLTNESDQLAGSIHLFSWKTHITTWPRHYLQMNLTSSQDQSIGSHGRHTSQHGPDITYKWIWPARRINPSVLMEDTHHNMAQTLLTNESDQLAGSIHLFSWKTHITTWPRHYLQMNLTSSQDQSICSHGRHTSQHGPDITYKWIWPARRINPSVLMEDTHHNMAQTLLTNESDQLAGSIHLFSWKTHITTWPRHYLQMNLTSSQDQSICSHGRHTSQHGPDITYRWIWPARRINPSVLMEDRHHNMAQTLLTN